MRRTIPDPTAMTAAVAARVDRVERDVAAVRETVADLGKDVAALGRGVADLSVQIRRITPGAQSPVVSPRSADDDEPADEVDQLGAAADEGDEEEDGQPDWLAVTDRAEAAAWLGECGEWARRVLIQQGVDLGVVPCWPLHPTVVADLLALREQRAHAYAQPDPTPVAEWLTRWLPAGVQRLRNDLQLCRRDVAHRDGEHLYDAAGLTSPNGLKDAATWWTTARATPAPAWLDLPRLS